MAPWPRHAPCCALPTATTGGNGEKRAKVRELFTDDRGTANSHPGGIWTLKVSAAVTALGDLPGGFLRSCLVVAQPGRSPCCLGSGGIRLSSCWSGLLAPACACRQGWVLTPAFLDASPYPLEGGFPLGHFKPKVQGSCAAGERDSVTWMLPLDGVGRSGGRKGHWVLARESSCWFGQPALDVTSKGQGHWPFSGDEGFLLLTAFYLFPGLLPTNIHLLPLLTA